MGAGILEIDSRYPLAAAGGEQRECYKERIIMMNTLLMLGWVALIVVSYKAAVAVLIKSDNL